MQRLFSPKGAVLDTHRDDAKRTYRSHYVQSRNRLWDRWTQSQQKVVHAWSIYILLFPVDSGYHDLQNPSFDAESL